MIQKKRILFSIAASGGALLAVMAVLEALLFLAPRIVPETWAPSLHAEKYRLLDREINDANRAVAAQNPFGFNDRVRTPEKPPGIRFRIAVVGDSFVWGDGLPPGRSWSRKLEREITGAAPWVEVMSWAQCGWATADELAFLEEHGREFGVDLVVVGWVDNDPDVGDIPQRYLTWQNHLGPLNILFPRVLGMLSGRINNLLYKTVLPGHGYGNWRRSLFGPENLARYGEVLSGLAGVCRDGGMDLLLVLTPNNCGGSFARDYERVVPLMEKSGIPVLSLLPVICERLGGRDPGELQANPGNGHPGEPVTDLYVEEVARYLRERPEYARLWEAPGVSEKP
ncbi:MAG: hypothetical protein KKA60_15965 [Proteobacteria bacterium]|nr:hypothetical protein [Pseudomonadota bacterium]